LLYYFELFSIFYFLIFSEHYLIFLEKFLNLKSYNLFSFYWLTISHFVLSFSCFMIFIEYAFSYLVRSSSFVFSLLFIYPLIIPITFISLLSFSFKTNYIYSCYLVNLLLHLKSYCHSRLIVGVEVPVKDPWGLFAFFRDLIDFYLVCDEEARQSYWE